MKSNELRIRLCTIDRLISEGWDRENIRIEIPMSTASNGGRADIVCLHDSYAGCIELKSGSDKPETEMLREQMAQYKRSFDYCSVIADDDLYKCVTKSSRNGRSSDDNFRYVDVAYKYSMYAQKGTFHSDPRKTFETQFHAELQSLTQTIFPQGRYGRSAITSVYDMSCVLWASELRKIFGT